MPISREEVVFVYQELLQRAPESESIIEEHIAGHDSVLSLVRHAVRGEEYRAGRRDAPSGPKFTKVADRVYEEIVINTRYAPWQSDQEFLDVYRLIINHTLVDGYRCWNLWHLVRQIAKRADGVNHFIEIGVWRGGTGVLIARAMASRGLTQPIYLCDTFQGVAKTGAADLYYHGGEHADTSLEIVSALAAASGLKAASFRIVAGEFPDYTPPPLKQGEFAFAHIDVDAYQSAKDCFFAIWPRMITGGVVVFDDYGFETTIGVARFVDELDSLPDGVWMYNLTGQAVVVKR